MTDCFEKVFKELTCHRVIGIKLRGKDISYTTNCLRHLTERIQEKDEWLSAIKVVNLSIIILVLVLIREHFLDNTRIDRGFLNRTPILLTIIRSPASVPSDTKLILCYSSMAANTGKDLPPKIAPT